MFYNKYEHTIDEKSRIRIPKEYRAKLGNDVVIGQGVTKCLYIYPREYFESLHESRLTADMFDYKKQYAMGEFISSYVNPEIDSQGRIIIPKDLKAYAGITKNIITRGNGDKIEIWSEEVYAKREIAPGSEFIRLLAPKENESGI